MYDQSIRFNQPDIRNAKVLELLHDYEGFIEYLVDWDECAYEEASYSKTTIRELERIFYDDIKNVPPLVILENYSEKMMRYAKMNPCTEHIFLTMHQTVENIIDSLVNSAD